MTKIVRSTISIDVYLPESQAADLDNASMEAILEEVDSGSWVASRPRATPVVAVPPEKLFDELKSVGADGSFFDSDLDGSPSL